MTHWKLTLAYDGTPYRGWQVQPNLPTVQGLLSDAIHRTVGERVLPQGSGRTDAGVHALAPGRQLLPGRAHPRRQPAPRPQPLPAAQHPRPLRRNRSSRLPRPPLRPRQNLRVPHLPPLRRDLVTGCPIHHGFIAMSGRKTSVPPPSLPTSGLVPGLSISTPSTRPPATFSAPTTSPPSPPPIPTSPTATGCPHRDSRDGIAQTPIRTITHSQWHAADGLFLYRVTANGFLHHMVRNLVGTFVQCGAHRSRPRSIPALLAARDRAAAGPTAPASGLFLVSVEYPGPTQ